jgi:hypothetical protein
VLVMPMTMMMAGANTLTTASSVSILTDPGPW